MAGMNDLADFMDSFIKRNAAAYLASALAKRASSAILQDLLLHTPVDTGEAVSNWQLTLDNSANSVIPAFVPSPKGRMLHGVWTHRADPNSTRLSNIPQALSNARTALQPKQPGQPIFITNNVEYIQQLNQGSSDQTPAGLVDRARIVGADEIKKGLAVVSIQTVTP